jgi:hypothetical protein
MAFKNCTDGLTDDVTQFIQNTSPTAFVRRTGFSGPRQSHGL